MTTQQLEATGYIIITEILSIESITYRDYLHSYGSDETTSPIGIAPRLHIREVNVNGSEAPQYQLWTWGINGNNPRLISTHETTEDAESDLYDSLYYYISEKNWDAPIFHEKMEDAIAHSANMAEREYEVIERYLKLSAITARKNREHREKVTKEQEAKKAALAIAVPLEAESLTIDQAFIDGVKELKTMIGQAKSTASAAIMKALLKRNNHTEIISDFWQVFRILKAKAEKSI